MFHIKLKNHVLASQQQSFVFSWLIDFYLMSFVNIVFGHNPQLSS
jgi:hypothetical protein